MLKSEKVTFMISTLEKLYPKVTPPLDHKDSYTLLIAVLLSAQSTDKGLIKLHQYYLVRQILHKKW